MQKNKLVIITFIIFLIKFESKKYVIKNGDKMDIPNTQLEKLYDSLKSKGVCVTQGSDYI